MNVHSPLAAVAAFDRRARRPSPGFLYVAVLFTTLIVMASVAAALSISTSNLRSETDRSHRGEALRYAESEIQRQAALMRTSSQWRDTSINGVFSDWYTIAIDGVVANSQSQVRRRFTDGDGDLADDLSDGVELTVHARVGQSEVALSVQLASDPAPLDLLRYAVTATDDLRFESLGSLSCERPVQVFDECQTDTTGILTTPRLECSGNVPMTLRGDLAGWAGTLPTDDVLAQYVALGTEIPAASIPQSGGDLILEDLVLSTTVNSLGPTDPAGIYWIDAQGNRIVIAHCRLAATLAIENASQIEINGGIVWDYPTDVDVILVSDSPIRFRDVQPVLDEAARSTNFNPPALPYRQSLQNVTATDRFPTRLCGVVYTSDDIRFDPLVNDALLLLTGNIVGRDIRVDGKLAISQLDELLVRPPAGLDDPTPMRLVRGSFRRIPTP